MRKPELEEICQWIVDAWQELDPQIIVHSFKKCCISNTLDGSEDDILWEDLATSDTTSANDTNANNDYYSETQGMMTDEEFNTFFDEADREYEQVEEFEGFSEEEIRGGV